MSKERETGEVIHTYTAEEAMREGLLIEVPTELRREAGYRIPVRITAGVAELLTSRETECEGEEDRLRRLWDTLHLARVAIANAERTAVTAQFEVTIGDKDTSLWACLDSTSGPAIHIITPEEY